MKNFNPDEPLKAHRASLGDEKLAIASLVAAAGCGSFLGIFARSLDVYLTPVQQVALRCGLGALVLGALVGPRTLVLAIFKASQRDLAISAARGVLLYGAGVTLSAYAFIHGNYAVVSIVLALPVVAVLGSAVFGDRLGPKRWALVVCAFLGAGSISLYGVALDTGSITPVASALAAAIFMGFGFVGQRAQGHTLAPIATATVMLITGAVVTGIVGAFQIVSGGSTPRFENLPTVLCLGLGAAALSVTNLLATNYGMPRVNGATANNVLALQPVFSIGVGAAVFGELMSPLQLLGALLILAAVILMPKGPVRRRRPGISEAVA
ncbi:MAG: DMT family transporter [Comamonadaceae bacterium]|nr:MAG: DMT family transporter [Comamonadaceae bacterium]